MIRKLHEVQVLDPARGSFMVHPLPVKVTTGKKAVYRSANHINRKKDGTVVNTEPHPEAYDFVVAA